MGKESQSKELSKIESVSIGSISSLGTVILYGTGVNLSKSLPNGTPVFIGTIILSFIAPHLLKSSATYFLTRYHQKQKSRGN